MSYRKVDAAEITCDQCGKKEIINHRYLFNSSMDGMGSEIGIDNMWYINSGWRRTRKDSLDFCSQECTEKYLEGILV